MIDKYCKFCGEYLDPEWAVTNQVYCDRKCCNADYYIHHKKLHQELYREHKREWEKSSTGKKAGVTIYDWIKLPQEFK